MRLLDWIGVAALIIIFVGLWIVWGHQSPQIASYFLNQGKPDVAGPWGDSFGAFNALFGALGFTAVLSTLIVQGRALKHQQNDQHKQRFESSFFALLQLLRELRSEIRFSHSSEYREVKGVRGKAVLGQPINPPINVGQAAVTAALTEVRYWLVEGRKTEGEITENEIVEVYSKYVHGRYEPALGAYFRIFYTILRRIKDDRVLTEYEKEQYGNMLRSQITSHELGLAAINSLSPVANDFRDLLGHFHFFKYLPEGRMKRMLKRIHGDRAFSARSTGKPSKRPSLFPLF